MREQLKRALAGLQRPARASGATLLIYHRVGGGTTDELDTGAPAFERQLDILSAHKVLSLDAALDRLDVGDSRPSVVLTFDDGFADIYRNAWPLLRERSVPFTIYLASAYMGRTLRWEGSTAKGASGLGLTWDQLTEMVASGLCTVGNHTHNHVRPEELTPDELDACSSEIEAMLGVRPKHFTYPWGSWCPRPSRGCGSASGARRPPSSGVISRTSTGCACGASRCDALTRTSSSPRSW